MKIRWMITLGLLALLLVSAMAQSPNHTKTEIKDNWKMHRFGTNIWYNATVPGCVHTDLISNKVIPDPFYRDNEKKIQWIDKNSWEYSTTFNVDAETLSKQNQELNFTGLDTYADVYLNDQLVLQADNMFIDWHVNVKKVLKEGANSLRILFHSPIVMGLLHKDQWDIEAPLGYNFDFGPGVQIMAGPTSDFPPVGPFTRKAAYMYGWDWSPKLTTSGIWRQVYLESWNDARINNLQVVQNEISTRKANVTVNVEIASNGSLTASLAVNYKVAGVEKTLPPVPVKLTAGTNTIPVPVVIDNPKLWWPNGMGDHPVYEFSVLLMQDGKQLDHLSAETGLRTVKLVRQPDQYGKSFYFEINGVPVFAKGANYVPTDIFPSRTTPEHYRTLLQSAADAHINMLRVWGGGIYESDLFYKLCDELGIMIWQDFAFSIYMMPGDEPFLNSIRHELADNIIRLRNHPSIVLWCGNNETELLWNLLEKHFFGFKIPHMEGNLFSALTNMPVTPVKPETTDKVIGAYKEVFDQIIPDALKQYDLNQRPYRTSSPSSGGGLDTYDQQSGDAHYYVAYVNKPFEDYYHVKSRFFSEHGFQSYPDFNTVKKFTLPEDWNYLSPIMQDHQRASNGNQVLDKYMRMYYRYPKDFPSYLYVSQVMQAQVMQMAFETHRRSRPYTMGTLYWQLNDVWPVASWAGMDYLNHWKALHYQVRRSFSNVILAPMYYQDTMRVWLVSDSLKALRGNLEMSIRDFKGMELKKIRLPAEIGANTAKLLFEKKKSEILQGIDTTDAVCVLSLVQGKKVLATNNLFFAAFKNLNLPKAKIDVKVTPVANGFKLEVQSDAFAKSVFLSTEEEGFFTDNYFDLLPGQKKVIFFTASQKGIDLQKGLQVMSLADTY